ncbi:OPA3-like protein [Linum perenne]
MVLPLLKLGTLVVKTLSKPLAAKLKQQAAYHPKFRQIIIDMAQMNHRISTRMQRRIYSHATDVAIRPLDEEKAVQAAVDLIGELFVFTEMRQRDDDLAREVDNLRQKLNEIEQLARGQGLTGLVHLKPSSKDPQRTMKPV